MMTGKCLMGRYLVGEVIGTGGMAVVYRARCHRLNRYVAVKILRDDMATDAESRRRFTTESKAISMLIDRTWISETVRLTEPPANTFVPAAMADGNGGTFRENDDAYTYLFLILLGTGATIFYNIVSNLLRALGDSKTPLIFLVISSLGNVGLDILFIVPLRMGVAGVAVPTLVSRAVGAVIILSLAAKRDYVLRITPRTVTRLEGRTVRSILYIGIPSAFENSLFQLGRVLVVSMISLFGTVHISANAVANNLDAVGCIVGNAMGLAMITVVGRCVGAQDFEQTKHYTKKLLLWDYIAQGTVNLLVLLFLNRILGMYTLSPETRALSWTLVMIHDGVAILLWPAGFVLPNALRAANDVRFTMVTSILSMIVWRMGLSWILCVNMGMGAVGVWLAMVVDWICRVTCFVIRFASGAWQKSAMKKV